jgi:hypothetical protein
VPFLVERDNRWFRRFAYVIASVQMLVLLFRLVPDEQASAFSLAPHISDGVQLLIKTVIHIF